MAPPDAESTWQATAGQAQLHFLDAMKSQLHNSNTSDFKIVCGDTTYDVHRLVISLRSKYFRRICEGGFAESASGTVTLHADPPFAVKLMIDYLYTFEYDFDPDKLEKLASTVEGGTLSPLKDSCWIVAIADKYFVPNLKTKALEEANDWLHTFRFSLHLHFRAILHAMESATAYVFSNMPPNDRCLKDAVVKTWIANDHILIKGTSRESFDKFLADIPEFAAELVAAMIKRGSGNGREGAVAEEGS